MNRNNNVLIIFWDFRSVLFIHEHLASIPRFVASLWIKQNLRIRKKTGFSNMRRRCSGWQCQTSERPPNTQTSSGFILDNNLPLPIVQTWHRTIIICSISWKRNLENTDSNTTLLWMCSCATRWTTALLTFFHYRMKKYYAIWRLCGKMEHNCICYKNIQLISKTKFWFILDIKKKKLKMIQRERRFLFWLL